MCRRAGGASTHTSSRCRVAKLKLLDLRKNQLTTLPESFGELAELKRLDLGKNQLTTLPESFGKLAKLKHLGPGHNNLETLPESYGKLAKLEQLERHRRRDGVGPRGGERRRRGEGPLPASGCDDVGDGGELGGVVVQV